MTGLAGKEVGPYIVQPGRKVLHHQTLIPDVVQIPASISSAFRFCSLAHVCSWACFSLALMAWWNVLQVLVLVGQYPGRS